MRGRCYRRHIERVKVKQRLIKRSSRSWHSIFDVNNIKRCPISWMDDVGGYSHFMYKTYTTKRSESKHKPKWGKSNSRDCDGRCRSKDNHRFRIMLKEEINIIYEDSNQ